MNQQVLKAVIFNNPIKNPLNSAKSSRVLIRHLRQQYRRNSYEFNQQQL